MRLPDFKTIGTWRRLGYQPYAPATFTPRKYSWYSFLLEANETKSTHVTFTLRREDCPAVYLNGKHIPQDATVKYLGIHLDCRLTWKTHIFTKRKQLGLLFQRIYWILGRKSELSLANKVLL